MFAGPKQGHIAIPHRTVSQLCDTVRCGMIARLTLLKIEL